MRLSALKHLVGAVQALSRCRRLRVLGSSALLASFPELGEPGGPLELSYDADLLVEPCDEALAAMLDEAVGEGSLFSLREGCHADILRPAIAQTLPPDWEERLVAVGVSEGDAAALSPEDLAAVKLRVGREKDLMICRHLLANGMLKPERLRLRLAATPMRKAEVVRVVSPSGDDPALRKAAPLTPA